jgi:Spy/CpxP family protein refolding chaperone
MKSWAKTLIGVVAVAALAAGGVFAGRSIAGSWMGGGRGGHHRHFSFDHIAKSLDLTAAQKSRVREILRSHRQEIATAVHSQVDARRTLRQAVMAQPTDEAAIESAGEGLGKVAGRNAVLLARIRAQIRPILTPAQTQKIDSFREHGDQNADRFLKDLDEFLNETH